MVVGDSGFSALLFLDAMRRARITAITRLRLDAALYDPAPLRPPGTIGRPWTKGARLPTLAATLAAKHTRWHVVVVPGWYGAGERTIEIASDVNQGMVDIGLQIRPSVSSQLKTISVCPGSSHVASTAMFQPAASALWLSDSTTR